LFQTKKLLFTVIAGALRFLTSLNWTTLSFSDGKAFVFFYNSTEDPSMGCYHQRGFSERNQASARREDEDFSVVPLRLKSDRG
jgi:hypothetical protein